MRGWLSIALALGACVFARPADAQLFSPGKLAQGHADLEGLDNCTQCHPKGGKLSAKLCLDCHEPLATRYEAERGYHGQEDVRSKACEKCHRDHKGRAYQMIRWTPSEFDHREADWPLEGAHEEVDCDKCHDPRLVVDQQVKRRLRNPHKASTYLGVSRRCDKCHFDEHRGQLPEDCGRCHDAAGFEPAKGFDHDKARFALRGAHQKVECEACHPREPDAQTPKGAFPKPVKADFARYRPIEHERCTDCHDDPHKGRLGPNCTDCHTENSWTEIVTKALKKRSFHDKTRYPLRGAHAQVSCDACHWPLGARKKVYRGLPFDRCDRCHLDAHEGQVEDDCEACHDVDGFLPARYSEQAHARTEYPLRGAHRMVGCARCHTAADPPPRFDRRVARQLRRRKRADRLSPARLALTDRRCLECHEDEHRGQLDARIAEDGCEGCHAQDSWTKVNLDHDEQTRYPLTGKHRKSGCGGCHRPTSDGGAINYRPIETACAACHPDVHFGQLANASGKTDCDRCHDTGGFEVEAFAHEETRFPLTGAHAGVDCARCHLVVKANQQTAVRYRPLPSECAGCHADYHQGAFDRFTTAGREGCDACHDTAAWAPARFDHAQVGWALAGRHQQARCASCHGTDLSRPLPRDCATCHLDPHRGELGQRCVGCHQQSSWASSFDADAHRSTAFPLSGAHAVIPCEECHGDAFTGGFVRAAADCMRCHGDDYAQAALTSLDHVQAGFDTRCLRCHNAATFDNGRFDGHEVCFAIGLGPHAGITCEGCHATVQGARVDGQCATNNARCTACHEHRREETDPEHRRVPGYQFEDRKCYECHPFAAR